MTLIVQNDNGTVTNANAYIDVAYFDSYHGDRGNAIPAGTTTDDKEKAIVRATDFVDRRFTYRGVQVNNPQSTMWPRSQAFDCSGRLIYNIPDAVKKATAEYALRALSAALAPDPTTDPSGALIVGKKETVGPISREYTFAADGVYRLPVYPMADNILKAACLTILGGRVLRGN